VWDDKRKLYTLPGDLSIDADGELWENCTYLDNSDNHLIIEQCTGLRDKNGKLIYAGDIIKVVDGCVHLCKMFEVVGCMMIRWEMRDLSNDEYDTLMVGSCVEIIGNIHEMESEND
jgi:uncharacterized phage protein (TIGR01671 family)